MTSSEVAKQVVSIVEAKILCTPSSSEFEMAYLARVALERIRFAITAMEQARSAAASLEEASLQLLDALDRLESFDRRFQDRFRCDYVRADNEAHGCRRARFSASGRSYA